jgi:hypothetical protein
MGRMIPKYVIGIEKQPEMASINMIKTMTTSTEKYDDVIVPLSHC